MSSAAVVSQPRRPGRPPCCSREVAVHVVQLRQRGLSYEQIANALNAERIPTPMGGSHWQKSHIDRLLHTKYIQNIIAELHCG